MKSHARLVMGALNWIWNELHQVLGYRKFPENDGGAPMTDDCRVWRDQPPPIALK